MAQYWLLTGPEPETVALLTSTEAPQSVVVPMYCLLLVLVRVVSEGQGGGARERHSPVTEGHEVVHVGIRGSLIVCAACVSTFGGLKDGGMPGRLDGGGVGTYAHTRGARR